MSAEEKDKTIRWYGDGLYSRMRPGRDGKIEEVFFGNVWIKVEQKMRTFKLRARGDKAARRALAVIQDNPEKAMKARQDAIDARKAEKAAPPLRFDALTDRFLAEYRSKGGTSASYVDPAKSWKAYFGKTIVTSITRPRVEAYRERLVRDKYGPRTVRGYVGNLGTMFKWAMLSCDPPLVTSNPAVGVKRPSEPDRQVEILSHVEEAALLKAVAGHAVAPLTEWCIASGLRRGEALTLKWEQIEASSGNILIPKSKTGKARAVPLTPRLTAILARVTKPDGSALVFHNEDGRPWKDRAASRALERALERAGIRKGAGDGAGDYQGVFNLLRHTFGSRLAEAGVPYGKIAKIMGNSARVCEKHYIRFADSDLKAAMLAVPSATVAGTVAEPEIKPIKRSRNHLQLVAK